MADKKISDFTESTTPSASDWAEIETSGGNSRKVKLSRLGAMTLLETLSPSAASSVDIESFASGGFSLVWIICDLTVSTDAVSIQGRCKHNGTYQTGNNYHRVASARNTAGTSDAMDSTNGSALLLSDSAAGYTVGNDTTENFVCDIKIYYPDSASKNKRVQCQALYSNSSAALIRADSSGMWVGTDSTTALTGFRIFPSSGTFTGTIKVIGVR